MPAEAINFTEVSETDGGHSLQDKMTGQNMYQMCISLLVFFFTPFLILNNDSMRQSKIENKFTEDNNTIKG